MEYYIDNIPVPSRTGNAIPTRNTGLYSIVELTENDGAESDIFLSVVARYSRLTTLSRNKANRRWNETRIRRNVWISLNSFAIKHVRHAETDLGFPRKRRTNSKISLSSHSRTWFRFFPIDKKYIGIRLLNNQL